MSAHPLHVNLLNPQERLTPSPVRFNVLLPIIAGVVVAFVILWGAFVGVQLAYANIQIARIRSKVEEHAAQSAQIESLKEKARNLQAEFDQFSYYRNGRVTRAILLKRLAEVMPEGITLSALSIPPPPDQNLKPPLGSRMPPLQGPTSTVERVELRLTGIAEREQDVFHLLQSMEGESFTGLVSIVKNQQNPAQNSPRVLDFRQEAPLNANGRHDVFFDVVYDLNPREFVK